MEQLEILEAFEGYPDAETGPGRHFRVGDKPDDLPADFAALIIAKGLARELETFLATAAEVPGVEARKEPQ